MGPHQKRSIAMPNIGDQGSAPERQPTPPKAIHSHVLDATHRRNRLAGLWAAELLGLIGYAAQDYVWSVMHPGHHDDHDKVHDDDHEEVIDKLAEDLAGHATEEEIRKKLSHFQQEAERHD
jgi:hypothetical protein